MPRIPGRGGIIRLYVRIWRWTTPPIPSIQPSYPSNYNSFILVFCSSNVIHPSIHHDLLLVLWQSERRFLRESPLARCFPRLPTLRSHHAHQSPILPQCRALLVRINLSPTSLPIPLSIFCCESEAAFSSLMSHGLRIRNGNEAARRNSVQDRSHKLEVTTPLMKLQQIEFLRKNPKFWSPIHCT